MIRFTLLLSACAGQATTSEPVDIAALQTTIDDLTDRLEAAEARVAAVEAWVPEAPDDDDIEARQPPGTVLEVIDCRDFDVRDIHFWSVDILPPMKPVGWMVWTESLQYDTDAKSRWRFSVPTSVQVEPVTCDPEYPMIHYRVSL